ncbi:hemolysin family protein [Chryseobacterium sp. A321]
MELLIIVLLILLNGVFAMSEMALVSSRTFKLESQAKRGNIGAKKALELSQHPTRFLSTVQIGITLIGILLGIYSGDKLTGQVQALLNQVDFLAPYSQPLSTVLILIAITYLSIVLGELFPKRIGMHFPEKIISVLATPMDILSKVTRPFVWLLTTSNNALAKLVGIDQTTEENVSEEELKALVKESAESGEIDEIERHIVERVFELGDRKVVSLITHRTSLVFFEVEDTWETIFEKIKDQQHAAYPVVSDTNPDEILGLVHVKELITHIGEDLDLQALLRQPLYFSENTSSYKVLEAFKTHRNYHAIIIDEFGTAKGLVTLNDIVDELIGETQETEDGDSSIEETSPGVWQISGQYPLADFSKAFDLDFDPEIYKNYTTVAGLFYHYFDGVPEEKDSVEIEGYRFEVLEKDHQRLVQFVVSES